MTATSSAVLRTDATSGRYLHIDALRAMAVLLVVAMHAGLPKVPGDSGVMAFFVISGFVITHVVLREQEKTNAFRIGDFYFKRAFKILPPLLIAVVVPTIIFGFVFKVFSVDLGSVAGQVFFYSNWQQAFGGGSGILPGTNVVWSLGIEEQFYIVFAILWVVLVRGRNSRRDLATIAIALIVLVPLWRVVLILQGADIARLLRATDTRIDAIAWGVLLATVYAMYRQNGARYLTRLGHPLWIGVALVVAVTGFVSSNDIYEITVRFVTVPAATAFLIAFGLVAPAGVVQSAFLRLASARIVQLIGLSSYSIYLVHYPFAKLIDAWVPWGPSLQGVLVKIVVGVLAGIAMYKVVEIPSLRLRRSIETRS
ncbi:acyltransferase family protein [Microbacterium sp. NPDC056052]|uniref:acyltransferase family protein n=1 Tax=Microbacterium sp. NPDC056052 TaxID=3345695 RepID=UPI0035E094AD